MLDTGDGTHLTVAYITHGCEDPDFVQQQIMSYIREELKADVVPVAMGPWWGKRSMLLDGASQLHAIVTAVQRHLTTLGHAVDLSRPPHIEVMK